MNVALYPEFFNDVFGPVMQPGSSSHMAGPCRLGRLARDLLGEEPARIRVLLDASGSFAGTLGVMNEDNALIAGALGMAPDDVRIYSARQVAARTGIDCSLELTTLAESTHANAVKFELTGRGGRAATLVGDSTGGGMIQTQRVDGYPLRLKGDSFVLLAFDPERRVSEAQGERVAAGLPAVVGRGESAAEGGGGVLHYWKMAEPPDPAPLQALLPGVRLALLRPVLPVVTRPGRRPQLFDTMTRWREIAQERGLPLWEVAVRYEMDAAAWTRDEVMAFMRHIERCMFRQTHGPYEPGAALPASPFKPAFAADWEAHARSGRRLTDELTAATLRWAMGAGAGIPGVPVVAGPMGGGGGYVHAALWAVKEAHGFSDEDLLRGLFVAAGVGAIAFTRSEPTGECTGCSGECGTCGAMAAAGVAEMAGGAPEQVEAAASLLLQAMTGIPCDPIPGGLGQPCRSRILTATCMAHVFADLALAGRDAVLPLHEAIDVVDAAGRRLPPELRCTSRGGAATAPTARAQAAAFGQWLKETGRDGTVRPPITVL